MTICVAVKVHDGVVFAADSAVALMAKSPEGASGVHNVWKHGLKVFNLYKNTVAMVAGMGSFGSISISNLAKELHIQLMDSVGNASCAVKDVTYKAHQFFHDEYQKLGPSPQDSFEFWIGGYGNQNHAEIWKVHILNGIFQDPTQLCTAEEGSKIIWGGQI